MTWVIALAAFALWAWGQSRPSQTVSSTASPASSLTSSPQAFLTWPSALLGQLRGARPSAAHPGLAADSVIEVLEQFDALMSTGISSVGVWQQLASRPGRCQPVAMRVHAQLLAGGTGSRALRNAIQHVTFASASARAGMLWFAQALTAAENTGASVRALTAAVLRQCREQQRRQQEEAMALAGAKASILVLSGLPVVGIVLSTFSGTGLLHSLGDGPSGWAALVMTIVLWSSGLWWSLRLVRSARQAGNHGEVSRRDISRTAALHSREEHLPDALTLELVAAISAHAVGLATATERLRPLATSDTLQHVHDLAQLSRRTGLPMVGLLRARASELHRAAEVSSTLALRRLTVWMVLPTALCFLPAFMLSTVLPVVFQLWSGMGA